MADSGKASGIPSPATGAAELASGGGNATAAGVSFQGSLGALFVTVGFAERKLDPRLDLGKAGVKSVRFESESPVDDLLVETTDQGYVYVQAKTSLSFSANLVSELGKSVEQFVRQWQLCATGDGKKGWNRPLNSETDRFVLAVGPTAPNTISTDLSQALTRRRMMATRDVTPQSQTDALDKFSTLLRMAWEKVYGVAPQPDDIDRLLDFCVVVRFDFAGPDLVAGSEMLRSELGRPDSAQAAFRSLAAICETHMASRTGGSIVQMRRQLEQAGVALLALPDFRKDVEAFRTFSERTQANLSASQVIRLDANTNVDVDRPVATAAVRAAQEGPLLLIGEPGAGKSGVLLGVGALLSLTGNEVLYLAVDRLPVAGMDGLRSEIGLSHPIREVLENWPGQHGGTLLIDGLDAVRGGTGEAVFRTLIADALAVPNGTWTVVASVRSFDLRLGQQFRTLFKGRPTEPEYLDKSFGDVRHVEVKPWGDAELQDLLAQAPSLKAALDAGGERLHDLALVPFNTQLLADLVAAGVEPSTLDQIANQSELLKTYWNHRVEQSGVQAEACLSAIVKEMISERALRAKQDTCRVAHASALEALLATGVLVSQSGGRYVAFRHNILFDYAASRLYLNPYDLDSLKVVLARSQGPGLLLAPAVGFLFQELWSSETDRTPFWTISTTLLEDRAIDPIARSVIARLACELPAGESDFFPLIQILRGTQGAATAFSGIVGALSIRLEDNASVVSIQPWAHVLAQLSADAKFSNAICFLLSLLLKLPGAAQNGSLGVAARNLLKHAFALPENEYARNLMHSGIDFVADTYATNIDESRALLGAVFTPERLGNYAHVEVPALASKVASIARHDADFVASFYGAVFGHQVTSKEQTFISGSQIMSLTSHESQDYDMARWHLAQYFREFLATNPTIAAVAMVQAVDSYIGSEHPLKEGYGEWHLQVEASE